MVGLLATSLLTSCKKDEPSGGTADGQGFIALTEQDNGNSKTHLVGPDVYWTANDQIKVANYLEGNTTIKNAYGFELTEGQDKREGSFYTGATYAEDFFDESLHDYVAVYPATSTITNATEVAFTLPATQNSDGTAIFAEGTNPMVAVSSNRTLQFKNVCGGLGFQLTGCEDVTSLRLTSKDPSVKLCGTYTVTLNASTGEPSLKSVTGGSNSVTLNSSATLSSTPQWFYFMLPPVNMSSGFTLEVFGDGGELLYKHDGPATNIVRNHIVRANNPAYAKIGAIHSAFSVSATKKVYFSKGNLQYHCSTSSPEWRFAENQYTVLHSANQDITSEYVQNSGAWIDLFSWATSGWDNTSVDVGSVYYHPWDNFRKPTPGPSADPYTTPIYQYNYFGYGPSTNNPSSPGMAGSHYDWGVHNPISNGGNVAGQWRTLTITEWNYLINTRKVTVGGVNNASYGLATIQGVKGAIILPDNWDGSVCASFTYGNSAFVNNFNASTTPTWAQMEAAGVVFLPVAGLCRNYSISRLNGDAAKDPVGFYWTSSYQSYTHAYDIRFGVDTNALTATTGNYHERSYGFAVRLVCNVL